MSRYSEIAQKDFACLGEENVCGYSLRGKWDVSGGKEGERGERREREKAERKGFLLPLTSR